MCLNISKPQSHYFYTEENNYLQNNHVETFYLKDWLCANCTLACIMQLFQWKPVFHKRIQTHPMLQILFLNSSHAIHN